MIPDFQTIMLPFLQILSDGEEHTTNETIQKLAEHFNLSEDELNEFLPSGAAKTFSNRVVWAKSHIKMAGFIENTKRSSFKITEAGKRFLETTPTEINLRILKTIPAYQERNGRIKEDDSTVDNDNLSSESTPE